VSELEGKEQQEYLDHAGSLLNRFEATSVLTWLVHSSTLFHASEDFSSHLDPWEVFVRQWKWKVPPRCGGQRVLRPSKSNLHRQLKLAMAPIMAFEAHHGNSKVASYISIRRPSNCNGPEAAVE
jgi:hypothetical protein